MTVSRDTKFVHLAWRQGEKMLEAVKYTMASDVKGEVAELFGVLDDNTGLTLRGTFIISPDGTLMNAEVNFYNLGRNVDEIMRKVKANLHLAKNPEQGCPAKWHKEGDKTLTPGPKMVGKVYEAMQ